MRGALNDVRIFFMENDPYFWYDFVQKATSYSLPHNSLE